MSPCLKEEHRHSGEHHGHHAKEALAAEGQRQLAGTPTRMLDREGSAKFAAPRQGPAPCLARQAPCRERRAHYFQLWHRAWGAHWPPEQVAALHLAARVSRAGIWFQCPGPQLWRGACGAHWPQAGRCTLSFRAGVLSRCPIRGPLPPAVRQCLGCSLHSPRRSAAQCHAGETSGSRTHCSASSCGTVLVYSHCSPSAVAAPCFCR